ncbi:unnamed protein product [Acanthoscelides obtectus]|nr:unnamed protein product [Acanthoscelides obtectus]CAK1682175.1 Ropporin-1-like protein [Acanthoscelides obtectus]
MIRILCLGKFDNPNSIPWIKFLGLCAAHLTEDLTHTMILICEILTEEPEGGSAMIPLKVFLDLYVFLAKTDASKPQILKNIQFTEAEINIWKEKVGETAIDRPPVEIEQHGGNISTYIRNNISLESIEKSDQSLDTSRQSEGNEMEDQGRRVSTKQKGSSHDKTAEPSESMSKAVANCEINQEQNQTSEAKGRECVVSAEKSGSNIQEGQVTNKESVSLDIDDVMKNGSICLKGIAQTSDESAGSVDNSVTSDVKRIFHENIPIDDPVNKMEDNTNGKISEENEVISHSEPFSYGEIHIDAIPGIGPPVPDELIQAVCEYMEKVAATQRGMVMPRNIRNYNCPPLEVLDY